MFESEIGEPPRPFFADTELNARGDAIFGSTFAVETPPNVVLVDPNVDGVVTGWLKNPVVVVVAVENGVVDAANGVVDAANGVVDAANGVVDAANGEEVAANGEDVAANGEELIENGVVAAVFRASGEAVLARGCDGVARLNPAALLAADVAINVFGNEENAVGAPDVTVAAAVALFAGRTPN